MYFIFRPYLVQINMSLIQKLEPPDNHQRPPGEAPQFGNLCRIQWMYLFIYLRLFNDAFSVSN
jgi:hypothetical protein